MKKLLIILLALALSVGVSGAQSKSKLRKQQGIEQAAQILLLGQFKVMYLRNENPPWWTSAALLDDITKLNSIEADSLNNTITVIYDDVEDRRTNEARQVVVRLNTKTGSLIIEKRCGGVLRSRLSRTYRDVSTLTNNDRRSDLYLH